MIQKALEDKRSKEIAAYLRIRDLLLHIAGAGSSVFREILRQKYRHTIGSGDAELPQPVGDQERVG